MDGPSPIIFVVNPHAGATKKTDLPQQLHSRLDLHKFKYETVHTQYGGHARQLSAEAVAQGIPFVIAVGGDGTVNECADSLMGTKSALGIIPMGSGNGLARDIGIPLETSKAITLLNHHEIKTIDCGMANGRSFFCTAGVGFDAYISKKFTLNKQRGFMGYLRNVIEEFLNYESREYSITYDRETKTLKAFAITFANAAQFGNDAYISPLADICDGKLDLCIVKEYPKHLGLSMGLRLFNRSMHKSRYVEIVRLEQARVSCPQACFYHVDGEVMQMQENGILEITVVPQALRVMVGHRPKPLK